MNTKKIISVTTGLAIAASMVLAIPAFAETNVSVSQSNVGWNGQGNSQLAPGHVAGLGGMNRGQGMMRPGVSGTVTAVNGNIITINGRQVFGSTTPTVSYTINTTNATVKKGNATTTVSSIAIGDMIAVQGTVTGTNVAATTIFDGVTGRMGINGNGDNDNLGKNGQNDQGRATSTPPILGNGQPVIAGTVSVVSGNTLTVTTASNVTYTVTIDASSTKILQGQNTVALSSIVVGSKVLIQGTVNGTSIVASTVIDQSGVPVAGEKSSQNKGQPKGFFTGIGQFFMHVFGF